jgi:hypothetical protein
MFLQSCISQRGSKAFRPQFVPGKVMLLREVQSEMPSVFPGKAGRGEHICTSNQWGAISVTADNGKLMGVRPEECIIIAMVPNPHATEGGAA